MIGVFTGLCDTSAILGLIWVMFRQVRTVTRLRKMIRGLDVRLEWLEKHRRPAPADAPHEHRDGYWVRADRPEMLSDRLGYPPGVGDADWAERRDGGVARESRAGRATPSNGPGMDSGGGMF